MWVGSQNRDGTKPGMSAISSLLKNVHNCRICEGLLPNSPRPVLQFHPRARILVAGQAPGRRAHDSGVPFQDASGDRLRDWLGLTSDVFYNPKNVAILPMGFCYPGTGKSGDLPPRKECAPAWREQLLGQLTNLKLTLVIGQYALAYHLPNSNQTVTGAVKAWRDNWPQLVALPHPSPRNNIWLRKNPWFEKDVLPKLRERVSMIVADED